MDEAQGTHFFFMAAMGPGAARLELEGTFTPGPTSTRAGVYQELRESARAKFGCSAKALNVTAFTLERNAIEA